MMDTKRVKQEVISALMDGELPQSETMRELSECQRAEDRHLWAVYHQIGDVLRSKELAIEFSDDFDVRMRARLEAEPVAVLDAVQSKRVDDSAPVTRPGGIGGLFAGWGGLTIHGIGLPGLLAMAVMVVIVVNLSSSHQPAVQEVASTSSQLAKAPTVALSAENNVQSENGLSDYVAEHKWYSPSFYSAGDGRVPAAMMAVTN